MRLFNLRLKPFCFAQRCLYRLLLLVATAVVVLSAVAINSLIRDADTARQGQAALARLEHKAHEFSALEWEVMYRGRLTPELAAKEQLTRNEMAEQFQWLSRLDFNLPQLERTKRRYAEYLKLAHQEFSLLEEGKVQEAKTLDRAGVDPAFDAFSDALREADAAFETEATTTLTEVQLGIFVVSFAATAVMGLLFWRFYQKQQVAAIATAEQRVLQQANEQLRIEITERAVAQHKLEETQDQLVKASRLAGMQEVASGVLHNVGNVLNSVNVSAALLRKSLHHSQVKNLIKATDLLRDHAADTAAFLVGDPRGQRLPGYLIKLGEHLATEQQTWLKELDALGKNIEHIKEIVTMQQTYARLSGVSENLRADELVGDALRMTEQALQARGVAVRCQFEPVPQVSVDKHKVLQILINLIRNAKHAAEAGRASDRLIQVLITGTPEWVQIKVQDNGVGIAPENLARIFQHGFTTKKDGHGFGLHSSVNAAREMGGRLTAQSDGPGTGATFTLELPVAKSAEVATT